MKTTTKKTGRTLAFALSLAALGAGSAAYAAQDGKPGRDADGNGAISRAEAQAGAERMFARMDANGDGKLDAADREARRNARFDRMDANKDGQVSRAEFAAMGPQHRMGEGRGGEGKAGMNGMHRGMGHGMHGGGMRGGHMRMMGMMDANKDGTVAKAEFVSAMTQRFERMDANKDGQVTQDERRANRDAMRAGAGHADHGAHR